MISRVKSGLEKGGVVKRSVQGFGFWVWCEGFVWGFSVLGFSLGSVLVYTSTTE